MFDAEAPWAPGAVRRYWLLTTEPPGFSGGIGVYTHQSARMLAGHGVAVTVLHHDPTTDDPVCGFRDGYRLIRFAGRGLDRRPIPHANLQGPLRAAREAGEMVRALIAAEGAPDIVEVQDYGALAHGVLKHRLMQPDADWPRVVVTAHRPNLHCVVTDDDSPHEHRTAFLGEAERWCYAAADAVLSPCRFILQPLAALGFPLDRAQVVFNPFDPADLAPPSPDLAPEALELQRRLHAATEPVLYFGKLQAQKGAPDLLASLHALQTEGEAPPVWMFGRDALLSGTPTTAYDALERRHGRLFASGRVRYFGGYGPGDLRALCERHPIVALPYREDCLPYAFIEAVLCGAIPLTRANGGQLELTPQELHDRLSAETTRPDAWAAKARALLALGPVERALLSARLQASVRARTDPAAVFTRKMEALARVTPTHRSPDYPFVHSEAELYGAPEAGRRDVLAEAVPQRGATRELRRAGPPLQAAPDLVSVIVPYFDMQAYVDETLAAIEAQDHCAVEVVIVDDGSPSAAARARLDAILAAPRRFPTRVLRKTNGGLADARNAGARVARGAYLYFLDADDVIHPATLSRSLTLLKRYRNVGYVGAGLKEFGESEAEWAVHDIDGPYIGFHNLQICAFLVRAEAWLEHGVNDPRMSLGMEDYESHLRMFAAGVRGVAIPEPLFSYRKRPGSMSKGFEAHGVAYLYRRAWRNNAQLLHRFGPDLVGLFAENGHGALAPSVGEESAAHRALFARDLPDLAEVADHLEERASRDGLSRALRARCWDGGAEWDYTAARLLLALDREPAFARQMLRAALSAQPDNGWFRLYAVIAELRDGRIGAAETLWTDTFPDFCRLELGSVAWIAALEAARGFPHVALALHRRLARAEVSIDPPPIDLARDAVAAAGAFADLHVSLAGLLRAEDSGRAARGAAERAVRESVADALSGEAIDALLARWRRTWVSAGLVAGRAQEAAGFWGRTADAYLAPWNSPALAPQEIADRGLWKALAGAEPLRTLSTAGRRLRRLAKA